MKKVFLVFIVVFVSLMSSMAVFASDYYIESYNLAIEVGNNAVHKIQEKIDFVFQTPRHGFYREIPYDYTSYNGVEASVTNLQCSEPFETEHENGYLVMQIGSADTTVYGSKSYTISYDYDLYADTNDGYDEFYFNLLGGGWECPVLEFSFSVLIPYVPGYDLSEILQDNVWISRGAYGSTSVVKYSVKFLSDGSALIWGSASNFSPYEALTLRVQLPDSWYKNAHTPWDYRNIFAIITPVVSLLLLVLAAWVWIQYGRDPVPIVLARFEAPEGLSPLLVGYLADKVANDKDIISMLFYWADKGLLSITEEEKDKFSFKKLKEIEQYAIESSTNIPFFEVQLFNGFFKHCAVGESVDFKDLEKSNFFECMTNVKARVPSFFKKEKSLTSPKSEVLAAIFAFIATIPLLCFFFRLSLCEFPPDVSYIALGIAIILPLLNAGVFHLLFRKWYIRTSNVISVIFSIVVSVLGLMILSAVGTAVVGDAVMVQAIVAVVSSALISLLASIMPRRSAYGNKMLEQVLGYREFIEKVELSVLRMLINDDPLLYYHVLSYAVVLGLENSWADKFKEITIPPASWYNGPSAFDAYYISRMASRMAHVVPASIIPKTSSSPNPGSRVGGSSFGGSGFAGGGFGGGGGRAW